MILYSQEYCECGCWEVLAECLHPRKNRKYIRGHNSRDVKNSSELGRRDKISKTMSERYPIYGNNVYQLHISNIGTKRTLKSKSLMSKRANERWEDPNQRKQISEAGKKLYLNGYVNPFKGKTHSDACIEKAREITKALWKLPEFVAKQIKARNVRQNKAEKKLEEILNDLFKNEWKFVGDGEVIIAGKCPDFININGQKKIIELYGDYWHKGQNPQDRIEVFKPYGYETLIVWEKELKDVPLLKEKLIEFHNNQRICYK